MLQHLLLAEGLEGLEGLVAVGVEEHLLEGSGSTMLHWQRAGAVPAPLAVVAAPGEDLAESALLAGHLGH